MGPYRNPPLSSGTYSPCPHENTAGDFHSPLVVPRLVLSIVTTRYRYAAATISAVNTGRYQ